MGDFPFKSVGGSPSGMFTRVVTERSLRARDSPHNL